MTIGERIKELRTFIGITLEKFGEPLGVKKGTVSAWETGRSAVRKSMINSICTTYNVNEIWLIDGIGNMFMTPIEDTAQLVSELLENDDDDFYQSILSLVKTYRQLSPESKTVLKEFGRKYLESRTSRND